MIKVELVKSLNTSAFKKYLDAERQPFFAAGMKLITADIIAGINNNKMVVGGAFPPLEPETIGLKGHGWALIDKGLLRDDYTYQKLNQWRKNEGQITVKPRSKDGDMPRNKVAEKVQLKGVNSRRGGKKFFYFFGISKDAANDVLVLFDNYILQALEQL